MIVRAAWLFLFAAFGCSSLPRGVRGPEADLLAREMMAAVNTRAWERTGAVRWRFGGRNDHLWDRLRNFARVEWGDVRVLLDLDRRMGIAFVGGKAVGGEEATALVDSAHARWTNDSFWLNPIPKVFDPGTEREKIRDRETGARGLLVRFTAGGRTPGDAYLFWLAGDGRPVRWQMWTSNIPLKGASATWDRWIALATGARISTLHQVGIFNLRLENVAGTFHLADLEAGEDPFAELIACRDRPERCARF